MLYVSIVKNDGSCLDVMDETISSWKQHWQHVNHYSKEEMDKNKYLLKFKAKMFYVWEAYHQVTAWLHHIEHHYFDKKY